MDSSGSAMEASFIKSQVCGWPEPRQLELIVGELTGTDQPGELCLARLSGLAGPVGGLLRIQLDSGECDEIGDDVGEADLADRLRRFCRSRRDLRLLPILCWRDRLPALERALARLLGGRSGPWTPTEVSKRHQLRRILPIEPVATELCIRFCKQPKQSAASVAMTNRLLADLKHCIGQDPNFSHLALTGRLKNCKLHQGDCAYYRCQLMASAIFDAFRDVVPPPPPPNCATAAAVAADSNSRAVASSNPVVSNSENDSSETEAESVCTPFPVRRRCQLQTCFSWPVSVPTPTLTARR
ncbi:hypothetical protein BOX15_Mlig005552g2 [Macrostomum lignano]|uniref:Uncharacterized protein n=1 Tax=Macrostomum lignano TaxID=282301 RepID=A0A267FF76_9PLAT|nr:hypothetical protein BOX15_Mlig005552g2 [Macrostomum lignano]